MSAEIVRLTGPEAPDVVAERTRPAGIVSGNPDTITKNYYTDHTGAFSCGYWESTRGKWAFTSAEDELCIILRGSVRLTSKSGTHHVFTKGDAFVIPKGFSGTWETIEDMAKFYAVFTPPNTATAKL